MKIKSEMSSFQCTTNQKNRGGRWSIISQLWFVWNCCLWKKSAAVEPIITKGVEKTSSSQFLRYPQHEELFFFFFLRAHWTLTVVSSFSTGTWHWQRHGQPALCWQGTSHGRLEQLHHSPKPLESHVNTAGNLILFVYLFGSQYVGFIIPCKNVYTNQMANNKKVIILSINFLH